MNIFQKLLVSRLKKNIKKPPPSNRRVTIYPPQKHVFYLMDFKNINTGEYYVLTGHNNNKFIIKEDYPETETSERSEEDVIKDSMAMKRYYRNIYELYNNKYYYLVSEYVRWPLIKYIFSETSNKIKQFITNNKKVETRSRIKILKIIKKLYIEEEIEQFHQVMLYTQKYGKRATKRPNRKKELKYIKLILDSLVESKDLKKVNGDYAFTGKGFQTLIEHEETEERRSLQNKQQWTIVFLTLGLFFTGLVQSGLLVFDQKLDFTGFSLKTFWQNNSTLIVAVSVILITLFTARWLLKIKRKI